MKDPETSPMRVVVYEGEGAGVLADGERSGILRVLLDRGYMASSARVGSRSRGSAAPGEKRFMVIGRFENGVAPELQDDAGQVQITTCDITDLGTDAVLKAVETARDGQQMNQPGSWKPWFPVIDYDRCTNCMQCLSFCLFDVYGVDDENQIQVQNNDNCKTNCPACSRVCPEVAIMFPKYASGPINGAPVRESDLSREKMKVDISSLLGGDIYSRLRDRSEAAKSRFSTERDSDKALNERKKCLTKLAAQGEIPAEVLASLPSPDEIARRADAAKEKAKAALAANQS
jgi:Pyruvate/2-oxoacid:ferredoxin oxidoreductase delta subunit